MPYTGAARIVKYGGIAAILGVMTTFDKSCSEETSGTLNVVSACLCDEMLECAIECPHVQAIHSHHPDAQAALQEEACRLLCNLAHQNSDVRARIRKTNGERIIQDVMRAHPDYSRVQEAGQDLLDRLYDRKQQRFAMNLPNEAGEETFTRI